MDMKTKPCRWATGELDVICLKWAPRGTYAYRRKCQASVETEQGPCIFCMENWTCTDSTAMDVICRTLNITCKKDRYEPVGVTLNKILPKPKLS